MKTRTLILFTFSILTSLGLRAEVLLTDDFTDNNRDGWYSRSADSLDDVSGGNVNFDLAGDESNGMLTYFTGSGTRDLAVGETMVFSFDLTLSTGGPLDVLSDRIRFGLLDSGDNRETADNSNFTDSIYADYAGYIGYVGVNGIGLSAIVERDQSNTNLVTTSATTALGASVDTSDFSIGTTYTLSLSIERTNVSTNTIMLDLDGLGSFSRTDTTTLRNGFDTALISFHGPGTDDAIVDNVNVTVIPEPSALLLSAMALLMGVVTLRRR